MMKEYNIAADYAGHAVSIDSLSPLGYQVLGLIAYQRQQYDSARVNLARYVELVQDGPQKEHARRILDQLSGRHPVGRDQ
jgi:hypothetical protein